MVPVILCQRLGLVKRNLFVGFQQCPAFAHITRLVFFSLSWQWLPARDQHPPEVVCSQIRAGQFGQPTRPGPQGTLIPYTNAHPSRSLPPPLLCWWDQRALFLLGNFLVACCPPPWTQVGTLRVGTRMAWAKSLAVPPPPCR